MTRALRAVCVCGWAAALAACAPRLVPLPAGAGTPSPDGPRVTTDATAACAQVRSLTAEIGLSGHVAGQRLRGRLLAGFAAPDSARLEAPAPFGRAVFTLVMRGGDATLVLNRDKRVLGHARPDEIIEALTGVALDGGDLRQVLAGCGFEVPEPAAGLAFGPDWLRVDGGEARRWFHQERGTWRLVASARGPLEVRYEDFAGARPGTVRLRQGAADAASATDIVLRLTQVEINSDLGPDVFRADVPEDAQPMTIEDLRRSGPLGEASGSAQP